MTNAFTSIMYVRFTANESNPEKWDGLEKARSVAQIHCFGHHFMPKFQVEVCHIPVFPPGTLVNEV